MIIETSTQHTSHTLSRGFSLVELMVALTIFSLVMTVSIGTLLVMVDANAKGQALYSVMTNMSFVTDSITRNIRTGYGHSCITFSQADAQFDVASQQNKDCSSSPREAIVFSRMIDDRRMGYRLYGTSIQQRIGTGGWFPITGDDVAITDFDVTLDGSEPYGAPGGADGADRQPVVELTIKGEVTNGLDEPTKFTLQSRVVRRILDY